MFFRHRLVASTLVLVSFASAFSNFTAPYAQADNATEVPVVINLPQDVTSHLTPEQNQTLQSLKVQAQADIKLVKDIKFAPPQSVFNNQAQIIVLRDLFEAPNASKELETLSKNADGSKKDLSSEQWTQLKEDGLFVVASQKYPGQYHVWKLNTALQKGAKNIQMSLNKSKASSLSEFMISIPESVVGSPNGPRINIVSGLRNTVYGLRDTLSDIVGLAETKPRYSEQEVLQILDQERAKYVVDSTQSQAKTQAETQVEKDLGFKPDFRLYDDNLMEKVLPVVSRLEQANADRFEQDKDNVTAQVTKSLEEKGLKGEELEQAIADQVSQVAQDRLFQAIQTSPEIEALSPGLGALLVRNGQAAQIIAAGEASLQKEVQQKQAEVLMRLQKEHSVKSEIPEWLENKIQVEVSAYYNEIRDGRYNDIVAKLVAAGLVQEAYITKKNIEFSVKEEANKTAELKAEDVAAREYLYDRIIYRPSKWNIKQDSHGMYYAETTKTSTVSSASYLWRLQNFVQGSVTMTKNSVYNLIYSNLWNGPVGLKALVKKDEFKSGAFVNRETGAIEYGRKSTATLRSRLQDIKEHNEEVRRQFEASPDNGLFGKNFGRMILNVKQPIIYYGGGGLLSLFQVGATAVNATFSAAAATTSVVWAPLTNLALLGFNATIFDTANPHARRYVGGEQSRSSVLPIVNHLLLRTGMRGIGQTIAGVEATTLVHPLVGGTKFVGGYIRAGVRKGYDALVRKVMNKGIAFGLGKISIPARDQKGIVKRVQGPGLSGDYFYQVSPELVSLALWAKMESETFNRYEQALSHQIATPQDRYRNFISVFGQFVGLEAVEKQLKDAAAENTKEANDALTDTRILYKKLLEIPDSAKIKLTQADLEKSVQMGAALSEKYYSAEMKGWSADQISQFWKSKDLKQGDYVGLSQKLLSSTFSPNILMPFEETDKNLKLTVDNSSVGRYLGDVLAGDSLKPLESYDVSIASPEKSKTFTSNTPQVGVSQICRTAFAKLMKPFKK